MFKFKLRENLNSYIFHITEILGNYRGSLILNSKKRNAKSWQLLYCEGNFARCLAFKVPANYIVLVPLRNMYKAVMI